MLDIKLIRENPEIVKKDLEKRGFNERKKEVDDLLRNDKEYREKLQELEKLRHKRNVLTDEVRELKKQGKDISKKIKEIKKIPEEIKKTEETVEQLKENIRNSLMRLPNILDKSVPKGKDENDNKVIRTVGKKTKFDFKPKSHVEVIESLNLADIERAGKTSGSRFYFLKNELVMLDLALQKFALDILAKKGFQPIWPPFMIRRKPYEGVTDLNDFEDVIYKIDKEDLYMIATSEHAIAAMHMDDVIDEKDLPLKYAGLSACFRKEAGSHGKDTKGLFRVHQFNKIEQFIFSKPETSWKHFEELIANAEEIFKKLDLPYRVVEMCTADIGTVAAKKYDLEVWMPVQDAYREAVSCSNCTDYQARRLNIKMGKVGGEKQILHTLNSTAIATSRAMVAIMENFQQKDCSVLIPKALQPYMNGLKSIKPKNG